MKISVNGTPRELPGESSVADVVGLLTGSPDARGVAVALNDEVVPRSRWAETVLSAGDSVEAITAVPGG
jgi:sulfur carrier protein